jgi:hypothetical protein
VLGTHCPVFHPSCICVEENALALVLTSFSLEFCTHGEGSFRCFHIITFQRRVVSWVCSLPVHSLFKGEWFFRCESSYEYNFIMLFQNIEDPNIEKSL